MSRLASCATILILTAIPTLAVQAQADAERGAFVMMVGADTIAVERFTFGGDTLSGQLTVVGQPRFEYVVTLAPDGLVRTIALTVFGPNAKVDAAPIQRALVTMRGDSAVVESGTNRRAFATPSDALPLLNNSFAITERFTARARALGDSIDTPGWSLSGGAVFPVAIRPNGPDSLVLTVANQPHRLRVDQAGRILGGTIPTARLSLSRVDGAAAQRVELGRPDYSAPTDAPYTAREVTVPGPGDFTLGGTLTVPKNASGPVPAIVTITGSGQQDRDEFVAVAGGYRIFRQVADTLGRRGIAVLRLDDRAIGASGGTPGTSADNADDIRAALAWLRAQPEIDGTRLALVGHSEGGLIAPMIAATDTLLKGLVLMAGPSQTGEEILAFQYRQAIEHEPTIEVIARDSAFAAALATLDSTAAVRPWLAFFRTYDPLATARRVRTPILILHGETDHQVTPEQAPALAAAFRAGGNTDVTVRLFPGLNHFFLADASGLPTNYSALTTNKVDPAVLGTLADWLVARLAVP
jgi:dienelactone hydrolase